MATSDSAHAPTTRRARTFLRVSGPAARGETIMSIGVALTTGLLGLDGDLRDHLVVHLNQSLANLTDLASAYDQAHWNVAGPNFAQLHQVFDDFADQTRVYMDMLA